ncbi:MAG: sugar ABC transporter ATP-binding protein [Acidobacteria bacterium]|nr:sugar ABC transporter ATP-binding protein [Acidobacteriota bacterium]MCI0723847.1 sugar ABC transporter ATP-binding protein [Acidobacteriota bacterium]
MSDNLVKLEKITKHFGGVTALDGVSFSIRQGEVHAVVGENGAGKSTLMKILAGVHQQDSGRILLRGEPVMIRDPLSARRQGISIVFQELNLFPHLTVAANIFANRELVSWSGLLDERSMYGATQQVFGTMGIQISPRCKVDKLSVGERQLVEIARTLQQHSDMIIMDEPNSALTEHESERLFEIVRRLRDRGITIIYVSHRLEEVFVIADRISVIRDGRYQGTWRTADTTMSQIVQAMIGRNIQETFPQRAPVSSAALVLDVRNLRPIPETGPISFQLHAGEILGFVGLEGSGVEDIFRSLFGLMDFTSGEIIYNAQQQDIHSPRDAVRRGWALIPANRHEQGLMMDWSIRKNTTLVILDQLISRLGLIDEAADRSAAAGYARQLNIVTDSLEKKVVQLSGGNQQKVVLAKWLATNPKVLMLNDPTRGVDIGAKWEIYQLCSQLAQQGIAILFTSSELEETLGLCDRILVLHKGQLIQEFQHGQATKTDAVYWMSGGTNVGTNGR